MSSQHETQVFKDLMSDKKEKKEQQKKYETEMKVFEFSLKAAIRKNLFNLWKEKLKK